MAGSHKFASSFSQLGRTDALLVHSPSYPGIKKSAKSITINHNGCFSLLPRSPSEFPEDLFALEPELRAEAAVDEDVGGGVDGEEEVADADHDARPQREALEPIRLAFHRVPERKVGDTRPLYTQYGL